MARRTSPSENGATTVWIASRSLGGVSITDISRRPTSDMFSVRGMGVAVMREHVHVAADLLQPLLMRHAEALLLVHDQQAQIVETHVARKQPVRADDDVHLALLPASASDFLLLAGAAEAAEHLDAHRKRRHAPAKRLVMLEDQHGGGRQHGHLFRIGDGLERRAHGDFGLAVAHVAAKQPVHRRGSLHVALDVGDGRGLVGRLGKFEGVLEFALPGRVRRKTRSPGAALRSA